MVVDLHDCMVSSVSSPAAVPAASMVTSPVKFLFQNVSPLAMVAASPSAFG